MRILLTIILLLGLIPDTCPQQYYYPTNYPRFTGPWGDTLSNPFAGGLNNPQFSNIDINGDTLIDLFVFDREDNKVLTFLAKNAGNGTFFFHAPGYESFFPEMISTVLLRDYNRDGKEDIFAYSSTWGAGMEVYKNISSGPVPRFRKVTGQLSAVFPRYSTNLYVTSTDIPGIEDIDGDGDLDIITFSILGGFVEYYRNIAVDSGYSLDSLIFYYADGCWGKFKEGMSGNDIDLGETCPRVGKTAKKHSGSTILPWDIDGDGDQDLLLGDISYPLLNLLINGRKEHQHPVDSMIRVEGSFPETGKPVNIKAFPAAFKVDVNHDGNPDMIVAPQSPGSALTQKQVWLYKDQNDASGTDLKFSEEDFLTGQMTDLGSFAIPAFFDHNGDGNIDLLVAARGDPSPSGEAVFRLVLFENHPNGDFAVFNKYREDYLGLEKDSFSFLRPAFGDIDNDGDEDLLLGLENGKLLYFRNNGGKGNPVKWQRITPGFASIDVGMFCSPYIADIDGDGLNDLVIGEGGGNLNYYRNTGSPLNPEFSLITDSLGKIRNRFLSSPVIEDLDRDGDPDMVLGNGGGKLEFFYNIRARLNGKFYSSDTLIYNFLSGRGENKYFGGLVMPSAAMLDPDSLPDIMLGNIRGGLTFLGSKKMERYLFPPGIRTPPSQPRDPSISLYPNPARRLVYLDFNKPRFFMNARITVRSLLGQKVLGKKTGKVRETVRLDISRLDQGIYIIKIFQPGEHWVINKKLIVVN